MIAAPATFRGHVRCQHRRPGPDIHERPVYLDTTPRRQHDRRGPVLVAVFHRSRLRRGRRCPAELHQRRQPAALQPVHERSTQVPALREQLRASAGSVAQLRSYDGDADSNGAQEPRPRRRRRRPRDASCGSALGRFWMESPSVVRLRLVPYDGYLAVGMPDHPGRVRANEVVTQRWPVGGHHNL